jgi:hypothetical protein
MEDINLTSDIKRVMIFLCFSSSTERRYESHNITLFTGHAKTRILILHIYDIRIYNTAIQMFIIIIH